MYISYIHICTHTYIDRFPQESFSRPTDSRFHFSTPFPPIECCGPANSLAHVVGPFSASQESWQLEQGGENCTHLDLPCLPSLKNWTKTVQNDLRVFTFGRFPSISMRFFGGKVFISWKLFRWTAVDCVEQIWTKNWCHIRPTILIGFDLVLNPQTSCFLLLPPLFWQKLVILDAQPLHNIETPQLPSTSQTLAIRHLKRWCHPFVVVGLQGSLFDGLALAV